MAPDAYVRLWLSPEFSSVCLRAIFRGTLFAQVRLTSPHNCLVLFRFFKKFVNKVLILCEGKPLFLEAVYLTSQFVMIFDKVLHCSIHIIARFSHPATDLILHGRINVCRFFNPFLYCRSIGPEVTQNLLEICLAFCEPVLESLAKNLFDENRPSLV